MRLFSALLLAAALACPATVSAQDLPVSAKPRLDSRSQQKWLEIEKWVVFCQDQRNQLVLKNMDGTPVPGGKFDGGAGCITTGVLVRDIYQEKRFRLNMLAEMLGHARVQVLGELMEATRSGDNSDLVAPLREMERAMADAERYADAVRAIMAKKIAGDVP